MRLYYFTTQKYGLLAIQKRRLKIARISELNDPFELLGWNLRDRKTRTKLKQWKDARNDECGILCFSQKWSNPLLWGHYADKHQGMVLAFDVPGTDIYLPIKYQQKRLPVPAGHEIQNADLDKLLLTKFTAWRYESEYRCFCPLNESINEDGLYFEPFSTHLKLAQVIVGDRSKIKRTKLAAVLDAEHSHVAYFKARPAFGTFSVVRNCNNSLWQ